MDINERITQKVRQFVKGVGKHPNEVFLGKRDFLELCDFIWEHRLVSGIKGSRYRGMLVVPCEDNSDIMCVRLECVEK